jgi:transcriptional regulator with XRE-family HTH domain
MRLRVQAGIPGRRLAEMIGISQSKISRIETGFTTPTAPEVAAWCDATGASPAERDILQTLTETVYRQTHNWQALLARKPHVQNEIGSLEQQSQWVRTFQPTIVPGLLQTEDYAARVFATFQVPYSQPDAEAAVAARIDRQRILHTGRRFDFVVTEAALRWRPGSREMLATQLERLIALSTLGKINIGVITFEKKALVPIPHGFVIYEAEEDPATSVTIETIHAYTEVTEPAAVALYTGEWRCLHEMAIFGDEFRTFVTGLIGELQAADR